MSGKSATAFANSRTGTAHDSPNRDRKVVYSRSTPRPISESDRRAIADFCQRQRIRRLAIFGSALRDDFGTDSDIDVLVEFERDAHPGLSFFTLNDELAAILGRRVDLVTPGAIRPAYRDAILTSARDIYVPA